MEEPVIDISNLTKYYGKVRAIDKIVLQVGEGEIFGFIGPNGAGKTTTIRILLNLIFPSSGSARIMGKDVIRQTKEIKQHVGYIPSDAGVYSSMDVREFLAYCSGFYRISNGQERIKELAGLFELDLDRKVADLSMGNRKKVSIIQSILHSPKLLILDEPTTGLDPLMQSVFFQLLKQENEKGMTILFSSHILAEVQTLCRRVAIIKEGSIVSLEDIATLRKRQLKKVFAEFHDPVMPEEFSDPEIIRMEQHGNISFNFMYSGNINKLLAILAGRNISNLRIEEPSLEEIFMHFYR